MNEAQIRQDALALPHSLRREFLERVCAGDQAMRDRIAAQIEDLTRPGNTTDAITVINRDARPLSPTTLEHIQVGGPPPRHLQRLDHFEVLECLGSGGMGVVYRVWDTHLNREVALKVLSTERTTQVGEERFFREAKAASQIQHPHVVKILHIAPEHNPPYFVMPLIQGPSLQELVHQTGPLEVGEIVRLGQEIASGLAAIHQAGLIHRDVKPANILLDGADRHAVLTDFGLAAGLEEARLTSSGMVAGTPLYMAPEQARDQVLDCRADLFSLGGVLYTLCTGHLPFRASSPMAVLRMVCEETPPTIRSINPAIPVWLVDIVNQLLEKDPADRFESAKQLAEILKACQDDLKQGRNPGKRRRRSNRSLARVGPLVTIGLSLLVLFPLFALTQAVGLPEPQSVAPAPPQREEAVAPRRPLPADRLQWENIPASLRASLGDPDLASPVVAGVLGDPLRRPAGNFTTAAFSPDGTMLALGSLTGTIDLVDGDSGAVLGGPFRAHKSEIRAMAFHPGGKRLASGGVNKQITISDPDQRRILQSLPADGEVVHLSYTDRGRRLIGLMATQESRTVLQTWSSESGRVLQRSQEWLGKPTALAYNPVVNLLAVASADGAIRILDALTFQLRRTFSNRQDPVLSLAFSPSGDRLYSGGADRCVRTWDPMGAELAQVQAPDAVISVACLNQMNEGILAAVCADGNLLVCEPETGKGLRLVKHGPQQLRFVQASPDGQTFAVGGGMSTLHLRDAKTLKEHSPFAGHRGRVLAVTFDREERQLATGGADGVVALWDAGTAKLLMRFPRLPSPVSSLAFSPDGKYLAGGGQDEKIRVWDLQNKTLFSEWKCSGRRSAVQVQFSPDGKQLAYGDGSGDVQVWTIQGELVRSWKAAEGGIRSLSFSSDGQLLATTSRDEGLRLWYSQSGDKVAFASQFSGQEIHRAAFDPRGKYLAGIDKSGTVLIWACSGASMDLIRRTPTSYGELTDLAFSADGSRLIGYSALSGALWICDPSDPKAQPEEPRSPVVLSDNSQRFGLGGSGRYVALPRSDGQVLILRVPIANDASTWWP